MSIEPVADQGELHERLKQRFIEFHGFPDLNAHELADDMIYFFEDHGALAALPLCSKHAPAPEAK